MVEIQITIEADGDDALHLLRLLQGTDLPIEAKVQEGLKAPEATPEPKSPIKRGAWTKGEEKKLLKLWQSGKTTLQCANALNRSSHSISGRLHQLRAVLGANTVRMGNRRVHSQKVE